MAKLMYVVAAGQHIDTDRVERFAEDVSAAYANPFSKQAEVKREQPQTAEEIKQHVLRLLGE